MSGYWEVCFYDLETGQEYEETFPGEGLAEKRLKDLKRQHPQGSGDVILASREVIFSISCDDKLEKLDMF